MFIIYVIDLSTKNKMQRRGFIFLQKSKIKTFGNRKKKFQLIHFRKSLLFIFVFLQKMLNVLSEHSFKDQNTFLEKVTRPNYCNRWPAVFIKGYP